MRRLALLSFCVLAASCVENLVGPGQEQMGTFAFEARLPTLANGGADPAFYTCPFEPLLSFKFQGAFSRNPDGGVYLTLSGPTTRDATFDGQLLRSTQTAKQCFEDCPQACPEEPVDGGTEMFIRETLAVALLSESQNKAGGNRCPPHPLDGGVPAGEGISLPGTVEGTTFFDALRACGELREEVLTNGSLQCESPDGGTFSFQPCTMWYSLEGVRI